ncbi:MAG TPA: GNAT family N-acetyltransferase [Bacilli bacterium]
MEKEIQIKELDKNIYQGYNVYHHYFTNTYYEIIRNPNGFTYQLTNGCLEKGFTLTLFEDWLEDPIAYGVFIKNEMVGFIEGSIESWHNLFRISNIYVNPKYRKQGLGSILMLKMIEVAKRKQARAVILETQSCNYQAISFYQKNGFNIIAINTIEYSNNDINNHEVRFDMALYL